MTIKTLNARASDVMSSPAVTVKPTATLAEAAALMIDRNIGCLPVTDSSGSLIGMLTERMLQAQLAAPGPPRASPFKAAPYSNSMWAIPASSIHPSSESATSASGRYTT